MEYNARHDTKPVRPRARDAAFGLDAETTTLGATERDEQQRQADPDRIAERAAPDFVIVDECGRAHHFDAARCPRAARPTGGWDRAPHHHRAHDAACVDAYHGHGCGTRADGGNRHRCMCGV